MPLTICSRFEKQQLARKLARDRYEISLRDKIILGPIDRYKKYNHFPWKFLLHIVMLAVTSYQVLTVVQIQTDFSYNSQAQWYYQFMSPDWLDDAPAVGGTFDIYAIGPLKNFTAQVVQNYYDLNSDQMFD